MIKSFPITPELLEVARRVVWFAEPTIALSNPLHFISHVLVYGTISDLHVLWKFVDKSDLKEILDNAPPGIFDIRSWVYWNLMCGRDSPPPLPQRKFDQE